MHELRNVTIFRIGKSGRILGSSSISHLQALRAPITRYGSTKSQAGSNDSQPAYRPFQHPKTSTQSSSDLEIQARVKKLRKQTLYVGAGLIVFFGSMYATSKFVRGEPKAPHVLPDEDVSNRYDHIAATFDKSVGSVESWSGINRLRKKLMKEVSGNVLEVSVGTGRNSDYYKETLCQSITMVDQSKAMIEIAQKTFKAAHPKYTARNFIIQSALDPIAAPPGGFDTIVQTMGLCSTPDPVGLLKRIGSVLKPATGRILLLEHGRGNYSWINKQLDRYAPHHADKFGCWWNRDIDKIVEESGLEVVTLKRFHLGTTWWIELKSKGP